MRDAHWHYDRAVHYYKSGKSQRVAAHLERCLRFGEHSERRGDDAASMRMHLRCPITQSLMVDPVIVSTGFTFEREAITMWISSHGRKCPISRGSLRHRVVPNLAVRALTHQFVETYGDLEFKSDYQQFLATRVDPAMMPD